ncbi:zinc finger protein 354C-like [Xyrichtys novacula]|uniref:Zinc finger protein 354C-like n=1 Tax=Xyrichtys novacula TaxID=13765 RepID=A0AAV1EXA3_XYRNO|nr:zinc finger protein 354C-like [Xyrichtys novacula]
MSAAVDFHSQIASIMEVLANAAVAEICKVVDDGYAVVQLEMSRSQKESEFLRRKIKLLELQVTRYRAERMKAAEGSASRFPGVRLLSRQRGDSSAGPSLQGRTRFLNRGPGAQQSVQKTAPIILDQDPDQEVVTTTKTESAEPEGEEEGELRIVKVEGAAETMPTHQGAPSETSNSRGGANPASTLPTATEDDVRRLSETEAQRCPPHLRDHQSGQEELKEETGDLTDKLSPSHSLLDWQDCSQAGDTVQPSCSSYKADSVAGSSSFSLMGAVRSLPVCADSNRPHRDLDQDRSESELDVVLINSRQGGAGGGDRAEGLTRSHYPRPTWEISTYNSPSINTASADPHHQQSWSGVQQMDHLSDQNLIFQAPSTQNQESGTHQPHLPFACPFCPRRYSHQCKLRIHQRAHTGEKPYQCPQCGKRFGQVCSVKRHQMVHTGEKPYPCPHCGKQFSTSTNLKVHQSVHTGEKRFSCSKCGKNFSFLSNLIRHQALHSNR